jgi:ABC-type lipoprotein release transport system permease subunit
MSPLRAARLLWRLGWRNIGRNPRRTALTSMTIVLGVGLCIAFLGLTDGLNADMIGSVTRADLGEVQVHRPGYLARRTLSLTMAHGGSLVKEAARPPGVVAAAPRAYAWAFATHDGRSLGVQLMGVDPAEEARVTTLPEKVVEGAFLAEPPTPWPQARPLTLAQQELDEKLTADETRAALAEIESLGGQDAGAAAPAAADVRSETRTLVAQVAPGPTAIPPALLGVKLARRLHARVGETIALLAQSEEGATVDQTVRVVGTFRTNYDAIDQTRVVMHLADLQHLLALGDGVHEIAIHVNGDDARAVAATLAARPALAGLSVEPWQALRPDLLDMLRANDVFMDMIVVVVFLLAGLGVANTMLMAVFDRRREFGVLRALGMRPRTLLAMVALETLILSVLSAALGVVLGLGLDYYLARHGLDVRFIGRFSLAGVGLEPVLHAAITTRGVTIPVATMVLVAALGSLFPAVVAARIRPAVGMRDA